MTTTKVLAVEGTSEIAYLRALDKRIDELSVRRRMTSTVAHELAHQLLTVNEANNNGSALTFLGPLIVVLKPCVPEDIPTDAALRLIRPLVTQSPAERLPSWCTSDFVGMPPGAWLTRTTVIEALAAHAQVKPQVSFRTSDRTGSVLAAGRRTFVYMLEGLLSMLRLLDIQLRSLRRERSLIIARGGRGLHIPAFVLSIIAVCRHYGYRSEPDDHASLIIRRHLVSMGSCPQT